MEVPELMDAGEGHVEIGVVHHGGPLEVAGTGQHLLFQIDGAPRQGTLAIVEIAVHRAGVDHGYPAGDPRLRVFVRLVEEVGAGQHGDQWIVGHPGQPRAVAVGG